MDITMKILLLGSLLAFVVDRAYSFPRVNVCRNKDYCRVKVRDQMNLTCSVSQSTPDVELKWLNKNTEEEEEELISETQRNQSANIYAVTTVEVTEGNFLEILVCRVFSKDPLIEHNDTMVLLESNVEEFPEEVFDIGLVKINKKGLFDIKVPDISAIVWKKFSPASYEYNIIGHFAFGKSKMFNSDFLINDEGFLQIKKMGVKHEGEYVCIYATQTGQGIQRFIVNAFIPPNPPFPTITGCTKRINCQISISGTGHLKCEMKGIRPNFELEWFYPGEGHSPVELIQKSTSFPGLRADTHDIVATTSFRVRKYHYNGDFNLSCRAVGSFEDMSLTSNITLHLTSEPPEDWIELFAWWRHTFYWILVVTIFFAIISSWIGDGFLISFLVLCYKVSREDKSETTETENQIEENEVVLVTEAETRVVNRKRGKRERIIKAEANLKYEDEQRLQEEETKNKKDKEEKEEYEMEEKDTPEKVPMLNGRTIKLEIDGSNPDLVIDQHQC